MNQKMKVFKVLQKNRTYAPLKNHLAQSSHRTYATIPKRNFIFTNDELRKLLDINDRRVRNHQFANMRSPNFARDRDQRVKRFHQGLNDQDLKSRVGRMQHSPNSYARRDSNQFMNKEDLSDFFGLNSSNPRKVPENIFEVRPQNSRSRMQRSNQSLQDPFHSFRDINQPRPEQLGRTHQKPIGQKVHEAMRSTAESTTPKMNTSIKNKPKTNESFKNFEKKVNRNSVEEKSSAINQSKPQSSKIMSDEEHSKFLEQQSRIKILEDKVKQYESQLSSMESELSSKDQEVCLIYVVLMHVYRKTIT